MVKTIWCQLTNKDSFCINKNCFFMIEMVVKLLFLWLKHVDVSGFRYIWGVHRGLGHVQPRFPLPLHLQVPISRLYLSFDHLSRWFVCYLKNTISEVLPRKQEICTSSKEFGFFRSNCRFFVRFLDHHLKTRHVDHLNTRLVRYSDVYCTAQNAVY